MRFLSRWFLVVLVGACGGGAEGFVGPPAGQQPPPGQQQPPPSAQRVCVGETPLCAVGWEVKPFPPDTSIRLLVIRFWNDGPACLQDVIAHAHYIIDGKEVGWHVVRSLRDMRGVLPVKEVTEAVIGSRPEAINLSRVEIISLREVPCL